MLSGSALKRAATRAAAGEIPFPCTEPDHEIEFLVYGKFDRPLPPEEAPFQWVPASSLLQDLGPFSTRLRDYMSLIPSQVRVRARA